MDYKDDGAREMQDLLFKTLSTSFLKNKNPYFENMQIQYHTSLWITVLGVLISAY